MDILFFLSFFAFAMLCARFSGAYLKKKLAHEDLLSPSYGFLIIYSLVYGLGVLELSPIEKELDDEQLYMHFGAVFCYAVGVFFAACRLKKAEFKIIRTNKKLEGTTIYILFGITALCAAYIFSVVGNPLTSGNTQHMRTLTIQIVGGWLTYIYRTIIITSFFLYAGCRAGLILKDNIYIRLTILLLGSLLCIVSGYRAYAITLIMMVVVFENFYVRQLNLSRLFFYGLLLGFAFAFAGALRSLQDYYGYSGLSSVWERVLIELQTPAFTVQQIQDGIPSKIDYFGWDMIWWPLSALLPGTQRSIGIELKVLLSLYWEGGGFAPSIAGGFYLIKGQITVWLGVMLVAYLLTKIYIQAVVTRSLYMISLYAYFFVYCLNSIRGGFFQEVIVLWFFVVILSMRFVFERKQAC